jgi:hypothetical protein
MLCASTAASLACNITKGTTALAWLCAVTVLAVTAMTSRHQGLMQLLLPLLPLLLN